MKDYKNDKRYFSGFSKPKIRLERDGENTVLRLPITGPASEVYKNIKEWPAEWCGLLNDRATIIEDPTEFVDDTGAALWRRVVSSEAITGADLIYNNTVYCEFFFKMRLSAYYYKKGPHYGIKGKEEVVWCNGVPLKDLLEDFSVRTCGGEFDMDFKGKNRLIVKDEHGSELSKEDIYLKINKNTDLFQLWKYDSLILYLLDGESNTDNNKLEKEREMI